jgi:hypothetical protein
MNWLTISTFATVALIATATTVLRPNAASTDSSVGSTGMMSLQELHTSASVNKLPIEGFEDMSLVYSTAAKR